MLNQESLNPILIDIFVLLHVSQDLASLIIYDGLFSKEIQDFKHI